MFSDVDESLRAALTANMPIVGGEVDLAFDRPTREWSSRLSKPTLNLFLADIRERTDLRDNQAMVKYLNSNVASRQQPPRRIDLAYVVTAWAKEAADEHRVLARAMAAMYRSSVIPLEHLKGVLVDSDYNLVTRVMPPDYLVKPADLWGVMDNELHASLTWAVTAPLDVFAAVEGPVVRTAEFAIGAIDQPWREVSLQIAGTVQRSGDRSAGIAGVEVVLEGTAFRAITTEMGRFTFRPVVPGEYDLVTTSPEGLVRRRRITVPSESYDIEM
jgi:hypothetical protein